MVNLFSKALKINYIYHVSRFKPERSQRRLVQRMKWSQSRWGRSLAGDLFSYSVGPPTPLDQSPGGFSQMSGSSGGGGGGSHPSYYGHVSLPPLPVESESRVSSMTIADVSPRLALKKVDNMHTILKMPLTS